MKNLKKALALFTAVATMSVSVSAFAGSLTVDGGFDDNPGVTADYTAIEEGTENKVVVTVENGTAEAGKQMSFLVLNDGTNLEEILEENILFIDQKEAADGEDTVFEGVINLDRIDESLEAIPAGAYPIRVGYYDANNNDVFTIAEATMVVAESTKYTVKFWNGSTLLNDGEFTYAKDADVTVPQDVTAPEHQHFVGWKAGQTTYKSDEIPAATANVDYYAEFEDDDKYDAVFKNGDADYETIKFFAGETITVPQTNPTSAEAHKNFAGWALSSAPEVVLGSQEHPFPTMTKAGATFVAVYTAEPQYDAVFYAEGYTDGKFATVPYYAGADIAAPQTNPEKANYTFQYWSLTAGGEAVEGYGQMTTAGAEFYAVFKENDKFTVTFMNADNETAAKTIKDYTGVAVTAPENPTKDGYDFVGWNTNKEATEGGTVITVIGTADVTYYPIFTKKQEEGKTVSVIWGNVDNSKIADSADATAIVSAVVGRTSKWLVDGYEFEFNSSVATKDGVSYNVSVGGVPFAWGNIDGSKIADSADATAVVSAVVGRTSKWTIGTQECTFNSANELVPITLTEINE